MPINQFEIWKAQPEGWGTPHFFVIISNDERCQDTRIHDVNGLACFTKRGAPKAVDVILNGADGFERITVCDCGIFFNLQKSSLKERLAVVSFERQNHIRAKIKDVFRLHHG
jgi:hypothetical protein